MVILLPLFSGRRVKRGLYKTSIGQLINSDINGSLNIIRKHVSLDVNDQRLKALPFMPVTVDPLRTSRFV